MDERTIGMTITEVSRALHIGVEQLREYAGRIRRSRSSQSGTS